MMREEGVVMELQESLALVRGVQKSACGSCHAESSCGTLSGGLGRRETRFLARNPLGAQVGQRVLLEVEEGQFLRASFILYVVPLVGLMVVGITARSILLALGFGSGAEGLAGLAGLAGMGGTFFLLQRRFKTNDPNRTDQQPLIAEILSPNTPPSCAVD
ncbi:MAG: SoxR reducing system RseC family protein [Magnetococcales bacterium]|nr:SoxR reducing system RseC family protein [Magnetococcales bacterium]